jgi:hypothetical protein
MDFDAANKKRDRRLRRRLLSTLHAARVSPRGGLHARQLVEIVAAAVPPADRFEDDGHAIGLLQDLVNKGLATLTDERTRRSQAFGLDYLFAAITNRGSMLLNETIEPDPDVDDERNLEGD